MIYLNYWQILGKLFSKTNEVRKMWMQFCTSIFYTRLRAEGSHTWPPRSPCLTPMNFFFGYYNTPPKTEENMKQSLTVTFQSITPTMLGIIRKSFKTDYYLQSVSYYIEHLLCVRR